MDGIERTARHAAQAALDKRADDVRLLDVRGVSEVADYFLICSGRSTTQVDTIADSVQQTLRAEGVRVRHREGTAASGWVLLDYGDVVVHVFLDSTRAFYALERLWGDVPTVRVEGG